MANYNRRKNSAKKRAYKQAEKVIKKAPAWVIVVAIILIIAIVGGYYYFYIYKKKPETQDPVVVNGELSIHILEFGNEYAGDCIYIKAGDNDIIVDGGARSSNLSVITNYINGYCTDKKIEYAFITHADQDHIDCFAGTTKENSSLFDIYSFGTIIDFALTNKTTATYYRYVEKRDKEVANDGAVHYTALECWNNQNGAKRSYSLSDDIQLDILYNYYYENKSSDENNYSVCFMLKHGDRNFLFTGDLEKEGEEELKKNNSLSQVEFFKAGHHGSYTATNDCLLEVIKPKICVVSCCAGSVEYTQNLSNTFPSQSFINRISKYTEKVYVPTMIETEQYYNDKDELKYRNKGERQLLNGNIVVSSDTDGVEVVCSNNNTLLKDTEWFKANRTMPTGWVS